jgi:hypothetical protein
MKYLTTTIILLFCLSLLGQVKNFNCDSMYILKQLDEMGVDNSSLLNNYESTYLNIIFKDSSDGFDFMKKKVGFIKISGKSGKVHYFNMQKKYIIDQNSPCDNGTLYIFDASQKEESGGYDAAIVYWSKRVITTENIVIRLKTKH